MGPDAPVEDLHLQLRIGASIDATKADKSSPVDEVVLDAS